jgi:hypothetical protein
MTVLYDTEGTDLDFDTTLFALTILISCKEYYIIQWLYNIATYVESCST